MPAISLAMPAACRYAGIESDGMRRGGLEQMKDVQVQDSPRLAPAIGLLDGDVEAPPELFPCGDVYGQQFPEPLRALHLVARLDSAFGDRAVARREHCHHLFDGDGAAFLQLHRERLRDAARVFP